MNFAYKYLLCILASIISKFLRSRIAYNCFYTGFGHLAWEMSFAKTFINEAKFRFILHPIGHKHKHVSNDFLLSLWTAEKGFVIFKSKLIARILNDCAEFWPFCRIDIGNTKKEFKSLDDDLLCKHNVAITDCYQRLIRSNNAIIANRKNGGTPLISIPKSIESECFNLLKNFGIKEDDWFVCVHAREDVNYHSARSNTIGNYNKASEYINNLGGKVIRIGKNVNHPISQPLSELMFDYACSSIKSRILDIFLLKNQRMFVGSQSGPAQAVESLFNIPVIMVGVSHWSRIGLHKGDFYTLNLLQSQDGEILSVKDYISRGLHMITCGAYDQKIKIIKNSENDIFDVVKEAYESNFLKKAHKESDLLRYNQIFTSMFPKSTPTHFLKSSLSTSFIKKNLSILFR